MCSIAEDILKGEEDASLSILGVNIVNEEKSSEASGSLRRMIARVMKMAYGRYLDRKSRVGSMRKLIDSYDLYGNEIV